MPVLAPECRDNSECPLHNACINRKCLNPCAVLDPCAVNAFCRVENHEPVCTCPSGYIGDPRTSCILPESELSSNIIFRIHRLLKIFSKIIFLFQRRLLLDAGPMMIVSRPWPASTLSVLTPATVEPTLSAMSTTTNLSASVLKVTLETLKLDVSKVGVLS